jgi:hypothetical protein
MNAPWRGRIANGPTRNQSPNSAAEFANPAESDQATGLCRVSSKETVRRREMRGVPRARKSCNVLSAEGRGLEPPTGFPAPDFESGRWPIRLPSGRAMKAQCQHRSVAILSVRRPWLNARWKRRQVPKRAKKPAAAPIRWTGSLRYIGEGTGHVASQNVRASRAPRVRLGLD